MTGSSRTERTEKVQVKKNQNGRRNIILKIILVIVILTAVYIGKNIYDIRTFSTVDETCRADTAIILGAAVYGDEPSPVYRERINHGITLYNEGYVDSLIVTGGSSDASEKTEAAVAKEYLMSQGIPEEDILMEDQSSITQENLENAEVIMAGRQMRTALVVSDPLHMKRAMLLAEDAGITAYSSPTPTTRYISLRTKIPFLARETFYYIGYKWYRLFLRGEFSDKTRCNRYSGIRKEKA